MNAALEETRPPFIPSATVPAFTGRQVASLLSMRMALFAGFQAAIAGLLAATGSDQAWSASAAWWPLAAIGANTVNLGVLARLARAEGFRLRSFYTPRSSSRRKDLLLAAALTLAAAPAAALPNILLGTWLFGDPQRALDLFVQPLPVWAAVAAVVLFPATTALTELPTYYGYLQPRLALLARRSWPVVAVPAMFHALQHAALPLIFDASFILWRALMFVPFAFLLSWAFRRRPSLMPFLVAVHFLLDLQAALLVLAAAGS